ncbi:DUF502 domain-containing protein [Salinirarus marinus]|uniref:DUF502 domain-containing protein n=1 Tax=Salinirarus marinus TaxID=3068310 RepID=UPI003C6C7155
MSIPRPPRRHARTARRAGRSLYRVALDVVLTGIAVIVPLVVTLYVLDIAFEFLAGALEPAIKVMQWAGLISGVREIGVVAFLLETDVVASEVQFVTELIAVLLLATGIVGVGVVARVSYGERLLDYFDAVVARIPGFGSIYRGFRRMSDVMIESDVENFREVKLVEFPRDGAYTVGFETAESPAAVELAADCEEMVTLFLPLAPNPVMGGFLAHVPKERVMDVDMTVSEGVESIVTSGIASDGRREEFVADDD